MSLGAAPSRFAARGLWLWIGFVSFGGPAAQIGLLHREFVERRAWLAEEEFQRALSLCMLLPGPEALQLAIYIGWRLHGRRGGLYSGLCFLGPAVLLLLGLSFVYAYAGTLPLVAGALRGLEAVVVALIGHALLRLARRSLDTPLQGIIAASALIALVATRLPYPLLLCGAALAGAVLGPSRRETVPARAPHATGMAGARAAMATAACGVALWLLPLAALFATGMRGLPMRLYLMLSKAALLTFGGAYAIVKYVSDDFVRVHGWITAQQSVAGLALAETTPGPLLIVLQFFGFSAGFNDPGASSRAAAGVLCALLASYAVFLPSFVLVLMLAPHLQRITTGARLGGALRGVTAFVVGVIASLGLTVASVVLLRPDRPAADWAAMLIALAAAVMLGRPRIGLHWVLAFGVAGGWLAGVAHL